MTLSGINELIKMKDIHFLSQCIPNETTALYKGAFRSVMKNKSASETLCCLLIIIDHKKSACEEAQGALVAKGFKGT